MRVRSFLAWVSTPDVPSDHHSKPPTSDLGTRWHRWNGDRIAVWFSAREDGSPTPASDGDLPPLVLGDDSEWQPAVRDANLAAGVPIRFDANTRELVLASSLIGLPPLFVYRSQNLTAITSDIHLLVGLSGARLRFDPMGVLQLARYGFPVDHRTLFAEVAIVPAGGVLRLTQTGETVFAQSWQLQAEPPLSAEAFVDRQIAAFTEALARIDISRTFLSMTGGLDTRTVFAALGERRTGMQAVTLTGPRRSLDARLAARLCAACGVRHQPITIGESFARDLPRLAATANRLSGGLSSVGQAPDVYLYESVGATYAARLSGNLGNQVGRGGTEGMGLRDAAMDVLSPDVRGNGSLAHWHAGVDGDERSVITFLISREILFSSIGNYGVGNHYAAQQSPYASRELIELLGRRPPTHRHPPLQSRVRMRLRDLRHRFLGEPERISFQRTLIRRLGGPAARIPVNWGWRPAGGVSPVGLVLGAATFVGMSARATGLDDGALGPLFAWTGLPSLHDFRESRRWLRVHLRTLTMDLLGARRTRESGIFDHPALLRILEEHFSGKRDHYKTVTFALDVAFATENFGL